MYSWREVHAQLSGFTTTTPNDKIETVTPMRFASVMHLDTNGKRKTTQMRWGFAKRSAAAPGNKPDHIHARAETIDELPTFRDAFAHRRGLLIVRTFNEGKTLPNGKTEQHTITPNDGIPIAIALIYERWQHDKGDELLTYVMVTVPPNKLIATITDRMPAIIPEEDWGKWLGETPASQAELKALLITKEPEWTMRLEKKDNTGIQPSLF